MIGLLLALLGALVGWLLWGGFTKNFEADSITILVIGILLGYNIGKKERSSIHT
jgi:hypothetical protein